MRNGVAEGDDVGDTAAVPVEVVAEVLASAEVEVRVAPVVLLVQEYPVAQAVLLAVVRLDSQVVHPVALLVLLVPGVPAVPAPVEARCLEMVCRIDCRTSRL